jgi:hypothetical protein
MPALVAAAPQAEPPPNTSPASVADQAQTKDGSAKQISTVEKPSVGKEASSASSTEVSVTEPPEPASPGTAASKPEAKPGELPKQEAKVTPEPELPDDTQEPKNPVPTLPFTSEKPSATKAAPSDARIPKKPSFDTVRVEKSGEALAAGTAAPGAGIVLKHNGKPVGKTVANKEGAWVIIPDAPLPPGLGQLTVEQKMPGALASATSEQTVAVVVPDNGKDKGPLVALVTPGAPTEVLQKPGLKSKEKTSSSSESRKLPVTLETVDYNDKGDIVFSGRAGSGAKVRLYVDNKPVGDAAATPEGKWNYLGKSEIPPGNHSLRVDHINGNGKVLNRIELPFRREEPERVVALRQPEPAPATPQPATAAAPEPAPAGKVRQSSQPEPSAETPATELPATPQEQQVTAAAPVTEAEPLQPRAGKIIIQPGNNLWRLSRVIYGRGTNYTVIYQANREHIRNPDRIYPGQIFTTPSATPPEKIDPKRKKPFSAEEAGASQ